LFEGSEASRFFVGESPNGKRILWFPRLPSQIEKVTFLSGAGEEEIFLVEGKR